MARAEKTAGKQRGRPFPKGQSGNPAGKPKGTRHQLTMLAEKLMADDATAVTEAVIEAAKGGDMTAARLILDRIAPARKGRPIVLELPIVETASDVLKALGAVVAGAANGEITPEEATAIAGVLEVKRRAIETADLERRLLALEQAEKVKP